MLFSEPFFLFFFLPLLLFIYYVSPRRCRNVILSTASLVFYAMGEWRFMGWMLGSIAVNYWIARGIEKTRGDVWARRLLILGVTSDLGLLIVFKYSGFFVSNVNALLQPMHGAALPVPHLLLPLGISFFTFHKISYKVDVYRGAAEARKAPLDLALYILLFPQLIAGPIVRYHEISAELIKRVTTLSDFAEGIRRFILGLGKKMIVANTVAYAVDQIFAIPGEQLTVGLAWLGIVCYALQIYFDFSGYSDMAIGLARMFGFHFPENFNYPYISTSITEFWRRWHMSLSRWFRDYVYIPLGGNRSGHGRTYLNLVLIFFLCGLWHGAGWSFVVWGMLHGSLLVLERIGVGQRLTAIPRPFRHLYTLLMVLVGWVFFRADTLPQAITFLRAMFGFARGDGAVYYAAMYINNELLLTLAVGAATAMPLRPWLRSVSEYLEGRMAGRVQGVYGYSTAILSTVILGSIFLYSIMLMAAGTYNPFIYFRF